MNNSNVEKEVSRLNFENFLWIVFAFLCIMNVYGDYNDEEYLKTNNNKFKDDSNKIFEFTLIVTLLIYIYFFFRNYNALKNASEKAKNLYLVKILGSSFLIAGVICLIYFQNNQSTFIGSPAI